MESKWVYQIILQFKIYSTLIYNTKWLLWLQYMWYGGYWEWSYQFWSALAITLGLSISRLLSIINLHWAIHKFNPMEPNLSIQESRTKVNRQYENSGHLNGHSNMKQFICVYVLHIYYSLGSSHCILQYEEWILVIQFVFYVTINKLQITSALTSK